MCNRNADKRHAAAAWLAKPGEYAPEEAIECPPTELSPYIMTWPLGQWAVWRTYADFRAGKPASLEGTQGGRQRAQEMWARLEPVAVPVAEKPVDLVW